jgi:histidyl-tRNA synthetase
MAKGKKTKRVAPELLKGFRDYAPAEQLARERILARLRDNFELMGFMPLQTAALERADVLLGPHYSAENLAELFGFNGPDEVEMALRYEFTLSLARYVAAEHNLPTPFRRYQYGNVWRVDKPGVGRYREFMQFDIDIVGTRNLLADAEIIAAMVTTFEHLDIERFVVRYSNRKILNGVVQWAKVDAEKGPDVMRVIDKLERQGQQAVIAELSEGRVDDSGAKIEGLRLPRDQIERLTEFIALVDPTAGGDIARKIEPVRELLADLPEADAGFDELAQIQRHLNALGIDSARTTVDLSVVRGLGYYTGPVFETMLLELPEYGSVFSGGRYDNLVERFSGQAVPAVGASIGIDRLFAALLELKALPLQKATSRVLVTVMDPGRLPEYLHMLREIRDAGIPAEVFTGDTKNLTKQLRYANRVGIPLAVIAGSEEFEREEVTVKNLEGGAEVASDVSDREKWLQAEGFQETIKRTELLNYLKQHIK